MSIDPDEFLAQEVVEVRHAPGELSFRAGPQLALLVGEWERSNDELVFKTQLETGSFHGQYVVEEPFLTLMRAAADEGTVMPYYGEGGSLGVCEFKFRPGPERCLIEVEHGATGAVLTFEAEALPLDEQPADRQARRFIFSFLPITTGEGASRQPDGDLIWYIRGREYETLQRWQHWQPRDALAERYWYRFGQGHGLSVRVSDTQSGARLDAADHDAR
jgi:hypothetical protein